MLTTLSILSLDQGPKWRAPEPDAAPAATPEPDAAPDAAPAATLAEAVARPFRALVAAVAVGWPASGGRGPREVRDRA